MTPITRVIVNIVRSETCTYEFEGIVDAERVDELIGTGEYQPFDSNIRSEDVDLVDLRVIDTPADDEPYGQKEPCPVCGAFGADQSCIDENDNLIDDHAERGGTP